MFMLPNIPVSVWEQIAVVIVFAFLLSGMGWILVRLFTQAIADVHAHYAQLIKDTNHQWQQYFDARSESSGLVNQRMLERLDELAGLIENLAVDFQTHDQLERQALERLSAGRSRATRKDHQ